MRNFVEYTVVFDGKPLYSILEVDGYRSRVSGLVDDLLARFGSAAYDRIKIFRHTVEDIPTSTFVAPSDKEVEDPNGVPASDFDVSK